MQFLLEPVTRYALVVARYNENLEWLSELSHDPKWDIHIYNDGESNIHTYGLKYYTEHRGDKNTVNCLL